MSSEVDLIKFIVGRIVGSEDKDNKDLLCSRYIDWDLFKDLIIYHELTPFVYLALKDFNSLLPQDLIEFLKNNYYCALIRCQHIWQEFLRISIAFEERGIALLPIKGTALLKDIYIHRPLRPMTDIDLLVKEADLRKAEAVFCDLGYRKELYGLKEEYWRKSQCHITFYRNGEDKLPFVELHWSLDFKRRNRNVLPEIWSRIREINVDGRIIKLLSPEDTLFSLVLHNRRFGKALNLKNIYDLIILLNKYGSGFDWEYVLKQSREYGICSTVFFSLYQSESLLEINIPNYVWKGLNIPTWKQGIIQHFIKKNTFLPNFERKVRQLYVKSHFLLYDSIWESIEYILNIPKEQFSKYYSLEPYAKRTDFLYQSRLFYIPLRGFLGLLHSLLVKRKMEKWNM